MNGWMILFLTLAGLAIALVGIIRWRSRDIEEVVLQGRPVLLRCSKDRIEGKSGGCSACGPESGC